MYREIAQQGTDYITNALAFVTALMWNNFIKNYIENNKNLKALEKSILLPIIVTILSVIVVITLKNILLKKIEEKNDI